MKTIIYQYQLVKSLKIFCIGMAFILFFISIIPFFKQSYLAFGIIFVAGICMVIASTYKKLLSYDSTNKVLLLSKNYLGMTLSKKQIQLTQNSQLKLVSEKVKGTNSMGYHESSTFETLSITGLVDSGNTLSEVVLCSEHMDKKKKAFIENIKSISNSIEIPIAGL